jgi:DNA-binding beta-propeller fold protein YncE
LAPPRIVAASAGTISGTSPSTDGRVWTLGGTHTVKTLTEIRMSDGEILNIAPASAASTGVAQSLTGQLAVGLGTANTGSLEFRNGSSGAVVAAVPLADPAISVAVGDDGTTFYVLNGHNDNRLGADNLAVVDSQTHQVQKTIAAPPASVAIQPTPDQSAVYVLTRFGQVNEISVATGQTEAQFTLNMIGVGLAIAPSGQTLFVLGGPPDARAIALVDLKTDSQASAVPAAANSVALASGVDDRHLYDFVGTPKVGNVQVIQLPSD